VLAWAQSTAGWEKDPIPAHELFPLPPTSIAKETHCMYPWNRDENITLIIQYTNPTPKHMRAWKL
jgi:hypothetical protein